MANVRYYQHTALSGALAADDRVPMDKKTGASSFATRYFTPAQMAAFVESGLGAAAISNDYNDLSNLPDLSAYVPNTRTVNGHALSADVTITPSDLGLVIGADVQAFDADLSAIAALTPSNDDIIQRKAGAWTNRTPAQFKTDLALVKADVGLGNVEDTALSTWAGSTNLITLGTVTTGVWNGTAIAYANLSLTGSIVNADISNSAAIAYSKLNLTGAILNADLAGSIANAKLANSAITIAGTSTSLGGSISLDTITGLSSTGIVKRTGANTLAIATSGTDYAPATSGTAILKGNGSGGFSNASGGTDYEVPLTFSTGLTRSTNTITVNTSQNIATLSNLTSNGFVKTIGGAGTLSVDTTSYVPTTTTVAGNALSGNISAATLTASLNAFTGDSGSGGMKGLVPAPASGDAAAGKYLKADGTWATVSGGGGITIGTTTVTGATDTYALYNNAGVVGARAVTGTGNAVLSTSPTITTPAITTSATITNNSLGTSTAAGIELTNTTAAAAGAQQVSPATIWTGQGWKTNATAASQAVNFQAYVLPVQGSANPTANWTLASQINGGGYTTRLTVDSAGVVYWGDTSAANISPASNGLLFGTSNKRAYIGGTNTAGLHGILVASGGIVGWTSDTSVTGFVNYDTILRRSAAANIALGFTDAASPVAQTLSVQNVVAGTSDTAGANWTFAGSRGTGTGVGGSILFQTAPAGSTGASQNALATALTILATTTPTVQIGTTGGALYFGNSNHSITATDASNTMVFVPSTGTTAMTLTNSWLGVIGNSGPDVTGIRTTGAAGGIDFTIAPQARGGNTGTGGAVYLHGGTGSTSGTPSVGGNTHVYGGAGGTNQNGGNVYIYGGALNGSGTDGSIYLGYNGSTSRGDVFIQGTDLVVSRAGAANLRHGSADSASPVPQIISVQNVVAGTSNTAGVNFTIAGSKGTGTGAGGSIIFQTAPAGTSGTSQNALVEAMRIKGTGVLQFPTTITAGGTTGNQTINKLTGTVNIAAAGTSVTVTNALVTTSSIVFAVIRTNDTTAVIKNVVPSSGSFVITLNAAATAEVSIGFIVFNS